MSMKKWILPLLVIVLVSGCVQMQQDIGVRIGDTVKVDYWLSIDGELKETTEGGGPLTFVVGSESIIPGFSEAVHGMRVGEEKTVEIQPDMGYGEYNPNATQESNISDIPGGENLTVGSVLVAKNMVGQEMPAIVTAIEDGIVTVDLNHPLAGKVLTFRVKLLEVVSGE